MVKKNRVFCSPDRQILPGFVGAVLLVALLAGLFEVLPGFPPAILFAAGAPTSPARPSRPVVIDLTKRLAPNEQALVDSASELLETANISYAMGGHKLGDEQACNTCNECLSRVEPKPKQRFSKCPECVQCSLDCSHFTQLVFTRAGFPYPYLPTANMLDLSADALARRFELIDSSTKRAGGAPGGGPDVATVKIGDLLVYRGHVVLVEKVHGGGRGDIVHATGGKDIRGPGQGIQRERYVDFGNFRGPLLRILRHKRFETAMSAPNKGDMPK